MEMKWNTIVNGDMSRVPRDEELLFTVFDEEDGETYVTSCWTDEEGYDGNLVARTGARYFGAECLTAWMELPEPYKPNTNALKVTLTEEEQKEVIKAMEKAIMIIDEVEF